MVAFPLRVLVALFLTVAIFTSTSLAATVVLANDSDWRFAYILGYYAPKKDFGFMALDSEASARDVIPYVLKKDDEIIIYSGPNPVIKNYEGFLRGNGFENVRTLSFESAYDLMFDVPESWGLNLRSAVLVSDSGGEWVLSAGPLAYASDSYLLLLNNRTKERIVSFVKNRNPEPVYVIGYAGKSLKEELPNATFIATGNRAQDSVEIAKIMRSTVPYSQVQVLSGMFLYLPSRPDDVPVWTGAKGRQPVLISYLNELPEVIFNFLKGDDIKAVVFVCPELDARWSDARTKLSDKTVLSLFAVGYVQVPTRAPGKPYPLPALFLPAADVSILPESASILPDGRVFLKIRNLGSSAGYAMPTLLTLNCSEGFTAELTPQKTTFVDARDSAILEYNFGQVIPVGTCSLYVEGTYGADKDRMELEFNASLPVAVQNVNDSSSIEVTRIVYSPRLERFVVYVKNVGDVPTHATVHLSAVLIDGVPTDLKTRQVLIRPGSTEKLYAKAYLTDADILDNPEIKYTARYGQDPRLPVNITSGSLPLEKEALQDVVLEFIQENSFLFLAALVLIIVILILLRKR